MTYRPGPTSHGRMCTMCGRKWAQSKLGLCRTCERAAGVEIRSTIEQEGERLVRRRAKLQGQVDRDRKDRIRESRVRLTKTYEGQDYVVMWHGGMDGGGYDFSQSEG